MVKQKKTNHLSHVLVGVWFVCVSSLAHLHGVKRHARLVEVRREAAVHALAAGGRVHVRAEVDLGDGREGEDGRYTTGGQGGQVPLQALAGSIDLRDSFMFVTLDPVPLHSIRRFRL